MESITIYPKNEKQRKQNENGLVQNYGFSPLRRKTLKRVGCGWESVLTMWVAVCALTR